MTLPISSRNGSTPTNPRQRAAEANSASSPYRRVLIVEDEATLRRVIARNLSGRGLVVREADSAEAAVGAMAQEPPDLLLLDINLPDRTGWDVLRELRQRDTEVPTIIISAVRANASRMAEFHPLAYLPNHFRSRLSCDWCSTHLVRSLSMTTRESITGPAT
jgi:DNA-binding response OmpR family regulator